MLDGHVLPPFAQFSSFHPQASVATFFNIPRRYVKSNMQIGDMSSNAHADDMKSQRGLRKSSRLHDARSGPTSNPRTKEEDPPSPTTTSSSGLRKRLSSLHEVVNGESATESNISAESRSPKSATSNTSSVDHSPQVCLCQPEPKIPRPRNAFILYRQHHQQAIIARNPGLNNPDISKIIGEQWKAESEESKKVWQDLAQEEKARHQELYPDYRYQPRRCGKSGPGSVTGQHTAIDKYRCPRCGGRSIKTPSSPFLDSSGTPTLPPPNYSEGGTPTTRYLPVMNNLSLESPVRRRAHGPSSLSNIQVPPLREENAVNSPGTPGFKKRRFDYGPPSATSVRRPEGPYYPQHARRDSLPPIHVQYSPPNSATMQPPRTPHDVRRPVVQPDAGAVSAVHAEQSPRSVEEVLMTFPYQNKIKLLGRISLPFKDSAPMPPSHRVRGAIIAIEGDDTIAIKELTEWLNERLLKDTEVTYHPRIVDPPRAPDDRGATFEGYLDLIREWHGRSKDMISYITASSASPTLAQHPNPIDRHTPPKHPLAQERKDSASESATPPTPPPMDSAGPRSPQGPQGPQATPIILLPTFQLTASIAYASRIPIQDAYSTTDHWQWMATLWRGTVGPDLTIYVKSYEREQGGQKPEMDDAVRCLTVWKEREGRFSDADLRRVMFEVGEFVAGLVGGKEA